MIEIIVILSQTQESGNLGAIARLCDNFDVRDLILINPLCEINETAYVRSTKGRRFLENAKIFADLREAQKYVDIIVGLSSRTGSLKNFTRTATSIQELSTELSNISGTIGLLFGGEENGLSNDEINQCEFLCHIPIETNNPVLNISHAVSIVLWEVRRLSNYSSIEKDNTRLMHRAEFETFMNYLKEVLPFSWVREEKYESTLKVFRSILSRAMVSDRESPALVGTIRSIHKTFVEGLPPDKREDEG